MRKLPSKRRIRWMSFDVKEGAACRTSISIFSTCCRRPKLSCVYRTSSSKMTFQISGITALFSSRFFGDSHRFFIIFPSRSLSSQMLPILKPHRPLRPIRKDRSVPLPAMTIHTTEDVSLRVNIIRAQNVPFSKSELLFIPSLISDSLRLLNFESNYWSLGKNTVHPFVEVSFQQLKTCTTAGNGSTPTWNQELVLPIKYNPFLHHFLHYIFKILIRLADGLRSLSSLQSIRDDLFIQLFDQVVVDLVDDDRERDTSVHQRYERHWLGGFTIPFSSIYKWSKVDSFTLSPTKNPFLICKLDKILNSKSFAGVYYI